MAHALSQRSLTALQFNNPSTKRAASSDGARFAIEGNVMGQPIHAHPEQVIAYAHVQYPPSLSGQQQIYAFGALSVNLRSRTDVEFRRHHRVYDRNAAGEPFADIFALMEPNALWLSAQPQGRGRMSRYRPGNNWLRYQMASYSLVHPRRRKHQNLRIREAALRAFAADYAIQIATPNASPATHARLVADRAQAVWLAWAIAALGADPDQQAIIAAFRAWRMLDEQRPIPI